MSTLTGPQPALCPAGCGSSAVQFLVGRGAFCLGCGVMVARVVGPEKPWITQAVTEFDASTPRLDPSSLTRLAVNDATSGRTRTGTK